MSDRDDPPYVTRGAGVPEAPLVSVCILVLDRVDLVEECLASGIRSRRRATEVVVVANGTPQSSLTPLGRRDDIVLIRSGVNLGFAGGCDLAVEFARGEYLVFVNDDSRLGPGCVDRLVDRAESDPGIGAVGSRILFPDGSLQEAGGIVWSDGTTAHVGRDQPVGSTAYLTPRDVDYASANGLLVTRSTWDAVHGFDERYHPAYYEDVELCMKVREQGLRVVYEPTALLYHHETQSSPDTYRRFLMDRNRERFVEAWSGALAELAPPPTGPRRAAIDAVVDRSRTLPALVADGAPEGDARDERPPSTRATGAAPSPEPAATPSTEAPCRSAHREGEGEGEPEGGDRVSAQLRRELLHARYDLEAKDAYIAVLEASLARLEAELTRRNRFRRAARAVGSRVVAVLPARLRRTFRSAGWWPG